MKTQSRGLRRRELLTKVPFSSVTVDRLERRGLFPKRHHVGRMVFWIESEVEAYLANLTTRETARSSCDQSVDA